jgi:adenosine kinase
MSRKKTPKKIAIIGHLVWDCLNYADGRSIETFGGIAYNLAALASVADSFTRIYPVCYLGKNIKNKAADFWANFPHIDWSLVRVLDQDQEIHILNYSSEGYRCENNLNLFPQIARANFKGCTGIDIGLVNFIGGDEFPPNSISWLKKKYRPLIYLDYHSLALSRISNGMRHFRRHPHWRKYISEADIVQMNEFELETLYPGILDSPEKICNAARMILRLGPRAVIITREYKDLIAAWREANLIRTEYFPIPNAPKIVDSTGCGDSFAAGFVYAMSQGKSIRACCLSGLKLAARKITFSGPGGFL